MLKFWSKRCVFSYVSDYGTFLRSFIDQFLPTLKDVNNDGSGQNFQYILNANSAPVDAIGVGCVSRDNCSPHLRCVVLCARSIDCESQAKKSGAFDPANSYQYFTLLFSISSVTSGRDRKTPRMKDIHREKTTALAWLLFQDYFSGTRV